MPTNRTVADFTPGELVRIRALTPISGRGGELALITAHKFAHAYVVKYLSDGKEDWWYANALARPEDTEEQLS